MLKPIISSDSHITEHPDTYVTRIDKKYKDTAPKIVHDEAKGDMFVIEGLKQPQVLRQTVDLGHVGT